MSVNTATSGVVMCNKQGIDRCKDVFLHQRVANAFLRSLNRLASEETLHSFLIASGLVSSA